MFEFRVKFHCSLFLRVQYSNNNVQSLVRIMAWRCPGDRPLSAPMRFSLPMHISYASLDLDAIDMVCPILLTPCLSMFYLLPVSQLRSDSGPRHQTAFCSTGRIRAPTLSTILPSSSTTAMRWQAWTRTPPSAMQPILKPNWWPWQRDTMMDSFMMQVLWNIYLTFQWRHNGHDSFSNHKPHDCLLSRLFSRLFRRRSKETSKLRVTGLCGGNSPGTGEFPAQMASNAENASIWWRHHVVEYLPHCGLLTPYGDRDLGQHWPRQWLGAVRTNVD